MGERKPSPYDDDRGLHGSGIMWSFSWGSRYRDLQIREGLRRREAKRLYKEGKKLLDEDRLEEALGLLNEAITLFPGNALCFFLRGHCYRKMKMYNRSQCDYSLAIQIDSQNSVYYGYRGIMEYHMKQYDKALEGLKFGVGEVEGSDTSHLVPSIRATFLYYMGCTYMGLRDLKKAIDSFSKAIELTNQTANNQLGTKCYNRRGKCHIATRNYDQGIEDLRSAMSLSGGSASGCYELGVALMDIGKIEDALQMFTNAIESCSNRAKDNAVNPVYYAKRGHAKALLKQYASALEDFSESIKLDPKSSSTYLSRANALRVMGMPRDALRDVVMSGLNEDRPDFLLTRGLVLMDLGETQSALSDFERIIQMGNNNIEQMGSAFHYAALMRRRMLQLETADKLVSRAIDIEEYDDTHWLLRGMIRQMQLRQTEAIQDFSRCAELQAMSGGGVSWKTFLLRGSSYLKLRDYDKALADFTEGQTRPGGRIKDTTHEFEDRNVIALLYCDYTLIENQYDNELSEAEADSILNFRKELEKNAGISYLTSKYMTQTLFGKKSTKGRRGSGKSRPTSKGGDGEGRSGATEEEEQSSDSDDSQLGGGSKESKEERPLESFRLILLGKAQTFFGMGEFVKCVQEASLGLSSQQKGDSLSLLDMKVLAKEGAEPGSPDAWDIEEAKKFTVQELNTIVNLLAVRGSALSHLGKHMRASIDFMKVIRLVPGIGSFFYKLGKQFLYMRLYPGALAEFHYALKTGLIPKKIGSAHYYAGLCYTYINNPIPAVQEYTLALQACYRLFKVSQDPRYSQMKRLPTMEELFEIECAEHERFKSLGLNVVAAGGDTGGTNTLGEFGPDIVASGSIRPQVNTTGDESLLLGSELERKKTRATSLQSNRYVNYTFENTIVPGTARILHERGKCFQSIGDDVRAIQDFSRVLELIPDDVNAIVRRSFSIKNVGNHELAARELRRADNFKDKLKLSGDIESFGVVGAFLSTVKFLELLPPGNEANDTKKENRFARRATAIGGKVVRLGENVYGDGETTGTRGDGVDGTQDRQGQERGQEQGLVGDDALGARDLITGEEDEAGDEDNDNITIIEE